MFSQLRRAKRRQKLILWLLVLVFVVPLLLFFHVGSDSLRGSDSTVAGTVFGRPIARDDFWQEYRTVSLALQEQLGYLPEALEPLLRQQTWDRLILREYARRHVTVTDEELAEAIANDPTFQQQGVFVPQLYYQYTTALGLGPKAYEQRLREQLRIQRLLDSVRAQVTVTEEELAEAYATAHERRRLSVVVVRPETFEASAEEALTESVLRQYYAEHQEPLREPTQRTIDYLGRSLQEAMADLEPIADEAIRQYYDEHDEDFVQEDGSRQPLDDVREPIRARLQQERAHQALLYLALDLQQDRDDGLRFEEISALRSLPIRTVGPLTSQTLQLPDGFTPAIVTAAFAAPIGQMTEVVRTTTGVFLLRPTQEIPSRIPSFEEATDRLRRLARAQRATEAARAHAETLRETLRESVQRGQTFEEAVLALGLEPLRPPPISQSDAIEGLGMMPALTERAFQLTLGEMSEVMDTPKGFALVVLEEIIPADPEQFARDKGSFTDRLLATKRQAHLAAWLEELRHQARLQNFLEEAS